MAEGDGRGARTVKSVSKRKERIYKVHGKTYLKPARESHQIVKVAIDPKYRKLLLQSSPDDSSITTRPYVVKHEPQQAYPNEATAPSRPEIASDTQI